MRTTIVRGSVLGIIAGTLTAFAFELMIPEAGFSYLDLRAVPSLLMWAFFLGWLPGLLVGAVAGAVIGANSRQLTSARTQFLVATLVTLIAVTVVQLMLPIAWNLPRLKIGATIAPIIFVLARVFMCLLIRAEMRDAARKQSAS